MGWSELLLIGVVALIVVGPKDLPVMFQSLGRMTAKVKRMAREFQNAMEDAADSTGVKDVAKDLNSAMSPRSMGVDKLREAADRFDKWDPTKTDSAKKLGPETAKLSADREEAKRKIQEATGKAAEARRAKEAIAASDAAELADEPDLPAADIAETGKEPVKPATKTAPAKTPARKPAAKKPAAKASAAKKPAAETAAAKTATARKPAAKRAAAKAPAAKKPAAKPKTKPAASGGTGVS